MPVAVVTVPVRVAAAPVGGAAVRTPVRGRGRGRAAPGPLRAGRSPVRGRRARGATWVEQMMVYGILLFTA